jgi:hypothetical protein
MELWRCAGFLGFTCGAAGDAAGGGVDLTVEFDWPRDVRRYPTWPAFSFVFVGVACPPRPPAICVSSSLPMARCTGTGTREGLGATAATEDGKVTRPLLESAICSSPTVNTASETMQAALARTSGRLVARFNAASERPLCIARIIS